MNARCARSTGHRLYEPCCRQLSRTKSRWPLGLWPVIRVLVHKNDALGFSCNSRGAAECCSWQANSYPKPNCGRPLPRSDRCCRCHLSFVDGRPHLTVPHYTARSTTFARQINPKRGATVACPGPPHSLHPLTHHHGLGTAHELAPQAPARR